MSNSGVVEQAETIVLRLLREVIPWQFAKKAIRAEMSLQQELGIDSLGKVAMAFRLEEEFGVDLSEFAENMNAIQTVDDLHTIARTVLERTQQA